MKKIISLGLVLLMCFSFCSCSNKKAFENSESAYYTLRSVHRKLDEISQDIISAWTMAILHDDELGVAGKGFTYFCDNLNIEQSDVEEALAQLASEHGDKSYDFYYDSVLDKWSYAGVYFDDSGIQFDCKYCFSYKKGQLYKNSSLISTCVGLVLAAYEKNNKLPVAGYELDNISPIVEELKSDYSSYEHTATVEKYYLTLKEYYEYCKSPSGSVIEASAKYKELQSAAESCYSTLKPVFSQN